VTEIGGRLITTGKTRVSVVLAILVIAAACITLYRDRYSASNLDIVPDSVEYTVAAHHLVASGQYKIVVNGHDMPPRYPPWFSLFFIAPAYAVLGPNPGNAIFPVTALAVLGLLLAFVLGRRVAGNLGGVLAALALLALPLYRHYGSIMMTDVPCTALLLLLCLLYLRLHPPVSSATPAIHSSYRFLSYAAAGLVAGLCAAIRPPFICAVIPFLVAAPLDQSPPRRLLNRVLLLLPPLAVVGGTMACNAAQYGSPFRSGYHFWCPVPYDFPRLTMSLRYLAPNGLTLAASGLGACILLSPAVVLLLRTRVEQSAPAAYATAKRMLLFGCLAGLPAVVFHMVYFFPDPRFFLPTACMLLVPAAGVIALWLPSRRRDVIAGILQGLVLAAVLGARFSLPRDEPARRLAADRISDNTRDNSVIVSSIDPAYLEFMVCRGSDRTVLPTSRAVEYASKVIAPTRPASLPRPDHWTDHDRAALLARGGIDPVQHVAMGSPAVISNALERGIPVYLDTSHLSWHEVMWASSLGNHFTVTRKAEHLHELQPR